MRQDDAKVRQLQLRTHSERNLRESHKKQHFKKQKKRQRKKSPEKMADEAGQDKDFGELNVEQMLAEEDAGQRHWTGHEQQQTKV
jgi:hypothetical protein